MKKHQWDRLPGESLKAFNAFQTYLRLGHERAIDLAHATAKGQQTSSSTAKNPRASGHWFAWAEQYDWVSRAVAHDDHIARVELEARETHARGQADLWAARESEVREHGFQVAQELLERARKMIEWPLERTRTETSEDGKTIITIIEPCNWSLNTAAKFLDTGFKVGSLTTGLETERLRVQIEFKAQTDQIFKAMFESIEEAGADDALTVVVLELFHAKLGKIEREFYGDGGKL